MDDWNREAAEQCINVGKKALGEGNDDKALRMFKKAKRLNPNLSDTVNRLIESMNNKEKNTSSSTTTSSSSTTKSDQRSQHHKKEDEPSKEPEYTPEQERECKRLMKVTNFYEILAIEKSATKRNIKKAYKKSALKFHPDRNQHPLATECFKKVGRAYLCLNDEKKRKIYDQYGVDNMKDAMMRQSYGRRPRQQQGFYGAYQQQQGYHDEFDFFEEMLREMMGQPRFHTRQYHRGPPQQHRRRAATENDPLRSACGMMLVFILLLCTMFMFNTQVGQQQPNMNPWQSSTYVDFKRSDIYSVKRQSYHHPNYGIIEYYTKPSIQNELRRNPSLTRQLDDQAFQALPHYLRYHCTQQREERKQKLYKARNHRDPNMRQKLLEDVENTKMFYCDRLKTMFHLEA